MNKFCRTIYLKAPVFSLLLSISVFANANSSAWLSSLTYYVNQSSAVNNTPILTNDEFQIKEDEPATFNVLANDSDLDGDDLIILSASASIGSIIINSDYSLGYSTEENVSGQDVITYVVTDRNGGNVEGIATIDITGVNDGVPVVENETLTYITGNAVNSFDILSNDTDIDADILTVTSVSALNGEVVINADYTINYIANAGFVGNDEIQYIIDDGNGGITTGTVSVTIYPINAIAPEVTGQIELTVQEESSLTLSLSDFTVQDEDSPAETIQLLVLGGSNYTVDGNTITPKDNVN